MLREQMHDWSVNMKENAYETCVKSSTPYDDKMIRCGNEERGGGGQCTAIAEKHRLLLVTVCDWCN